MKIGLTYDLRAWYLDRGYSMEDTAEFDKQETVDAIDSALLFMSCIGILVLEFFQQHSTGVRETTTELPCIGL